ncbi:hypothetical protein Aph01nite_73840 [Acrocarpospora phusangensis]|uniref:Uncharacterized protein n=1 Tax=Acrocarpospora phusangensis TaxID=1070424 RepID=A0A919UPQ7_9ACTN|nr:hypothetical protein [Acrocarpospora phusangensis]GIH29074.1 hypothetical protein Aph01nite_73840 [Acrocarpospora phusangensis]
MKSAERTLPPQPTGGKQPCSYSCGRTARGWRWVPAAREWLPVCDSHSGGQVVAAAGNYYPDFATSVPRQPPPEQRDSITCPRCGRTSHHPVDVAEGYCGHCHDFTGRPSGEG